MDGEAEIPEDLLFLFEDMGPDPHIDAGVDDVIILD
jgi:hypothetical protein